MAATEDDDSTDEALDGMIVPEGDVEGDADSDTLHFRFNATKTQTRRIDQFLSDRMVHLSRAMVQRLIDDELVKVNGRPTKASYKIKSGDAIEMFAPPVPVSELVPEDIPLDIVYEDEHFLALNKQANLIVHPARGVWKGTLVNGLVHYGKKWSSLNGNWRPGILHRLDKNTTGVMLVAKSDEAHWRLARQFENRTIQKTYVAVVHGVPQFISDIIDLPIGKDSKVREKQAVRKVESGGKVATTRYEVQERFEQVVDHELIASVHASDKKLAAPPARFAFVKLWPKTGRTHQLRVHMSAIGYPMVGDTMYGGRTFSADDFAFTRQALHAFEITFVHPVTLNTMTLSAPLPPDIQQLLGALRGNVQT
ncbi:MAG TPA: RluA family pseudouridine synthase [Tepidisphaeraceae bacterium]|jgi:23S rRNA pseudouridine1911/1915/1917 synthase|nr:RluA family pseudouridine synthase [Tepidisphaeraceae bacterium]